MKKILIALLVIMLLSACLEVDAQPRAESDSGQNFNANEQNRVPVDDGIYVISGVVAADIESLTRQTQAAYGYTGGSGFGFSGSYYGPEFGGKGFIRLSVMESNSYLAPKGSVVILKSTDTKGIALLPGDVVTFKCRHQYEAVAAVRDNETFDAEKLETWEIDYCRLVTPEIYPSEGR